MAEKNPNKLITIMLAIIICAAAVTLLYVSLQQDDTDTNEEENNETPEEPVVLLNVSYNNTYKEYTLDDLEDDFTATTGAGRYVKSKALPDTVIITPDLNESAWEFTGVTILDLVNEFEDIPDNYNITVVSSDDWTSEFDKLTVQGVVDIYDENGEVIDATGATMILAYKQDGEYITDEEVGPLRIAFVGEDAITLSSLWSKRVISIEIVEL